jgi:hypothetical protein
MERLRDRDGHGTVLNVKRGNINSLTTERTRMSVLRSVALAPVWLLQVFGMSKSFKDNPILGSPTLNRLGLHVGRLIAAHALNRFRLFTLSPLVDAATRQRFARDGFIVIENLLPAEQFKALEAEVRACRAPVRECIQGDTLTHRILLDEETLQAMPAVARLLDDAAYERLLKYCAARLKRPLYYIQSIKNGFVPGGPDPQKVLHADTFHPTMKAWYFIDAVTPDKGPFTYVPGSHRLSWARLKWEYRRSIEGRHLHDGYSEKGSMRAEAADLAELGLPAPKAIWAKPNTLVVADTHGFHCRGDAAPRSSRLEIWAYSRTNPFNPLPGLGLKLSSRIEHRLAHAWWNWEDERARRRNTLSSWHPVPSEKMHEG